MMDSAELSEWEAYFKLEAADMDAHKPNGGGSQSVHTMGGTSTVEPD